MISLSQWMNTGPMYHDPEMYESAQCPPSYNSQQQFDVNATYEEPLDNNLFSWPYENVGYDASFSSLPEPNTHSNAFTPSVSVVSCSPRSESSALSLSPQPNLHEYSNAFNFNFNHSMTPQHRSQQQFPSSSSAWQTQTLPAMTASPRSSMSHSPSASCSSLDGAEVKASPSRDASPMRTATEAVDPQASRRRFPCIIIGCDRRFTSQYTLKVHMEAHKPKPRTSFPCTLGCSERFSRQHDRLRHEVAKHGKVCEFLCDECGRFFSTKKTLGNHKCPVAQGGTRWVNQ
ncbi:hypothetical protein BDN70DRAFT_440644 [Pholiota conissans]|uniref:C2H2-type domain-containing protein n=1 Tax=Pholiota conissans TaxID=109636 RepID=A0A9P5YP10_9AGAR|nr:hypothetical protein BDN70DRAFT_440644 [Pholiota conissans]